MFKRARVKQNNKQEHQLENVEQPKPKQSLSTELIHDILHDGGSLRVDISESPARFHTTLVCADLGIDRFVELPVLEDTFLLLKIISNPLFIPRPFNPLNVVNAGVDMWPKTSRYDVALGLTDKSKQLVASAQWTGVALQGARVHMHVFSDQSGKDIEPLTPSMVLSVMFNLTTTT